MNHSYAHYSRRLIEQLLKYKIISHSRFSASMRHLIGTWILALLAFTTQSLHADIGEISVDSEVLSPDLFAIEQMRGLTAELRCPPHSDKRVRDSVVEDWLIVKAAEQNGYELSAFYIESITEKYANSADLAALLERKKWTEIFIENPDQLIRMAGDFRTNNDFRVSKEALKAEYERLVKAGDPLVVDVPVVRATKVNLDIDDETDRAKLDSIAEKHAKGASWLELLPLFAGNGLTEDDVAEYAKEWHTIEGLERYKSTEVRSLVGDGRDLKAGDLIGPLPPVQGYRSLFYVHELTIVDTLPLYVKLNFVSDILKRDIETRVKINQRALDVKSLLQGRVILEDGEPFTPGGPYERCP